MMKFLALVILLVLCGVGQAQQNTEKPDDKDSGIIYGPDHVFVLTAPKGWVLDNKSAVGQGVQAVFYPEGSSWKNGIVVMYARAHHKKNATAETLEQVIAADIADFKKDSKNLKVVEAP